MEGATASAPMDIDAAAPLAGATAKGKAPLSATGRAAPWVEKYRPQSLADVAAHRDIVDTIDRLTNENRLPHLLLYGPPGTGKTSTILAVARKLYGSQYSNMILELNASDERGIDVVRQQIQDFAGARSLSFGAKPAVKMVLLDEADAMTKDAQFALRRVIEKYTRSTRFALICNHVNKIIPALQSRLDVDEGGLTALVRLSNGDMRKALNIYCRSCLLPSNVTVHSKLTIVQHDFDSYGFVFKIQMPSDVRVKLINDLADIEYRLSLACNDKLQFGALISTFTDARTAMVAAAS
ncbi:hypothetical protein PR202_gb10000 [Eleusine coracana subsp. coracana]|uniref:AAA+ ATPase domain-containing protein n=1 Tax=Eleusine coracana subsp. coracana TaxID=191504 RepID=A0AAV5EJ13_ELECO|nr:hypothetical protein PR202_gb10000 [Eleusine coracana subsp. coracana]